MLSFTSRALKRGKQAPVLSPGYVRVLSLSHPRIRWEDLYRIFHRGWDSCYLEINGQRKEGAVSSFDKTRYATYDSRTRIPCMRRSLLTVKVSKIHVVGVFPEMIATVWSFNVYDRQRLVWCICCHLQSCDHSLTSWRLEGKHSCSLNSKVTYNDLKFHTPSLLRPCSSDLSWDSVLDIGTSCHWTHSTLSIRPISFQRTIYKTRHRIL